MANDVTKKQQEQMPSYFMTGLSKLNLNDRFLFDETMEDKESYQAVVSILLENEVELLEKPETEKELRISPQLREVRLDVVSMDVEKKIYYTEMQKKNTGNLKRRSRYYQAQLDVSLLEPGTADFNKLNDSCFIMIAPFDIFGKNLYRYTFEGTCRECPELSLGDGAVRIFINTKGGNREEFSQEFLDFMDYINTSTDEVADRTDSAKIKMIHEKVKRIKVSEKMGVKYMQKWEEIAYAREEGRSEEIVKCVESAMENFHVDLQRACEGLGTTIEEYSKAKTSMELQGTSNFFDFP
ncbi:MAG: Rpn family recombination-promoting nuclease/putative transposase [Lachnospiraceae bacterium]|nr:Rpn family recombination-promoting nuclease/putative transposase [Lachnospiraceae bacterium]